MPNLSLTLHHTTTYHRKERHLTKVYYILNEDKQWLEQRIAQLEKEIQDLGPDFFDVFNQSSETWHDNAPFDALRDKQSVLFAEYTQLRTIRRSSALSLPKPKKHTVNLGSVIQVKDRRYKIAGTWTPHAGQPVSGVMVISAESPLAVACLGKTLGTVTPFGEITDIVEG